MSKGPGKIERAIEENFLADPDQAPTTEELCQAVYRGVNQVEKKHRVAVLRAARNVCDRLPGWGYWKGEGRGGTVVWWNQYSVRSYALAKIKTDAIARYGSKDQRLPEHWRTTLEDARAMIEPGGKYHQNVVEGGHWHRHVRLWTIERDKDTSAEAIAFKAESDRIEGRLSAMLGVLGGAIRSRS